MPVLEKFLTQWNLQHKHNSKHIYIYKMSKTTHVYPSETDNLIVIILKRNSCAEKAGKCTVD